MKLLFNWYAKVGTVCIQTLVTYIREAWFYVTHPAHKTTLTVQIIQININSLDYKLHCRKLLS